MAAAPGGSTQLEVAVVASFLEAPVLHPVSSMIRDELAQHVVVLLETVGVFLYPLVPTLAHAPELNNQHPKPFFPGHPTINHQLLSDSSIVATPLLTTRRGGSSGSLVYLRAKEIGIGSFCLNHRVIGP